MDLCVSKGQVQRGRLYCCPCIQNFPLVKWRYWQSCTKEVPNAALGRKESKTSTTGPISHAEVTNLVVPPMPLQTTYSILEGVHFECEQVSGKEHAA